MNQIVVKTLVKELLQEMNKNLMKEITEDKFIKNKKT